MTSIPTLYIDPGTGSMLFTVLLGVIGALVYSVRMLTIRLKTKLGGGKAVTDAKRLGLVIFSDNKRYWTTFAPIVRELCARGRDVTYLTASEDDPALSLDLEHLKAEYIGPGNRVFTRLNYLNADLVFSTTPGLDVYQWKRSKQVGYYVHIPHAASDITLYRMFGIDYYDAILLSDEQQREDIRALEQLRKLPQKELYMAGIPYMDEMAARLRKAQAEDGAIAHKPDGPTVLLAPSWGKSALFGVYGGRIIEKLLQTGYHIVVRPHPQSFQSEADLMKALMERFPASDRLEWNRDADNFAVLRRSDILVSDFSGVVYDFTLVYDKPVIYTDPDIDLAPYDAWWLGKELTTARALPRLGERLSEENIDHLKALIDGCLSQRRYDESRAKVRDELWAYQGQGAARAADFLCRKLDELRKEAK